MTCRTCTRGPNTLRLGRPFGQWARTVVVVVCLVDHPSLEEVAATWIFLSGRHSATWHLVSVMKEWI